MKRLMVGAVLAALLGAPGLARAEAPAAVPAGATSARAEQRTERAEQAGDAEAAELERREQASPEQAEFAGGAEGVYITGGAIAIALLVVLLLVAL